jgi:hypothetical protein
LKHLIPKSNHIIHLKEYPLSHNRHCCGALSFTLTQNTVFLQGSWSDSFSNASYSNSGTAYGAVIGNNKVAFGAIPTSPTACRFVVVGTLSGTTIAGAYAAPTTGAYACSTPDTGTFSVTEH